MEVVLHKEKSRVETHFKSQNRMAVCKSSLQTRMLQNPVLLLLGRLFAKLKSKLSVSMRMGWSIDLQTDGQLFFAVHQRQALVTAKLWVDTI